MMAMVLTTGPGRPSLFKGIGPARNLTKEPSIAELASNGREWLEDCLERHELCGSRSGPLPKRVIDVGSDTDDPRIYTTSSEIGTYVALSHCWGGAPAAATLQKHLAERERCLPLDLLPATFKDAVKLCRALDIKYLWIDSLCIVQDDKEEWAEEAGKMSSVYENSIFVIAADSAWNCQAGCLPKRRWSTAFEWKLLPGTQPASLDGKTIFCDQDLPLLCPNQKRDGDTTVFIRLTQRNEPRKGEVAHKLYNFNEGHTPSRLDQRGWCFQERLLGKRILHVGTSELAWECAETHDCECQFVPTGSSEHLRWKSELEWSPRMDKNESMILRNRWIWTNVVGEYTRRQLTYSTDRLPALAGIATTMKSDAAADYVCGLWKSDLLNWLCWFVARHSNNPNITDTTPIVSRRQPYYLAPTWSWASVTGPISYGIEEPQVDKNHKIVYNVNKGEAKWLDLTGESVHKAEILSVECEPANPANPCRPVKPYAKLKVRGYVGDWKRYAEQLQDVDRPEQGVHFQEDVKGDEFEPEEIESLDVVTLQIRNIPADGYNKGQVEYKALVVRRNALGLYERVGFLSKACQEPHDWQSVIRSVSIQEIVLV
jgi:hypothetical protein